jgi:hypothetical protein
MLRKNRRRMPEDENRASSCGIRCSRADLPPSIADTRLCAARKAGGEARNPEKQGAFSRVKRAKAELGGQKSPPATILGYLMARCSSRSLGATPCQPACTIGYHAEYTKSTCLLPSVFYIWPLPSADCGGPSSVKRMTRSPVEVLMSVCRLRTSRTRLRRPNTRCSRLRTGPSVGLEEVTTRALSLSTSQHCSHRKKVVVIRRVGSPCGFVVSDSLHMYRTTYSSRHIPFCSSGTIHLPMETPCKSGGIWDDRFSLEIAPDYDYGVEVQNG